MRRSALFLLAGLLLPPLLPPPGAEAQEARARWERMAQIRREKFDEILPGAMRENGIEMWIVARREGYDDPLTPDLGGGYVSDVGYYVFTDRGGSGIERAALGISGYLLEEGGGYDIVMSELDIRAFAAERDPATIGVNTAEHIGAADGLTHTMYLRLREELGEPYGSRLTSAQKLVSDFRARRVATEIAAFAEAGEISREIAERAFSNEVITPGVTTLEDVAWWMMEELHRRNLGTSFGMPSVYVTGPDGIEATSSDRIIRRGDLLMIDWGVGFLNFYTDMKRVAYVLREGEDDAPPGIRNAFEQGLRVREILEENIRPGRTAQETLDLLVREIEEAGFHYLETFNEPTDEPVTDVVIGSHSVGNLGHGIGPSVAFFNPERLTYEIVPSTLLSIELFAWTPAPEWGGAKVRIPLEDDAVVTDRGVEWLYP
ncbi:MAG: M24 family metallopeptidase, partial [Gemmatimonadetes bacterium]|nr:M24 family metallopeptidase [Gemmatimonadota bacterium]NIR79305.1 M24 family metallopeptidase [Gemmatimonadota bacterium]NIT87962.1 M24 family metallopeptidase [Gemmatimonadota bacterium]NIU31813.1 M24 family metallopeptidase [Gemmatimonadota bacterium]NIU36428.1 M24 family metallopeptidase [Gemmatimonadota bacterium]